MVWFLTVVSVQSGTKVLHHVIDSEPVELKILWTINYRKQMLLFRINLRGHINRRGCSTIVRDCIIVLVSRDPPRNVSCNLNSVRSLDVKHHHGTLLRCTTLLLHKTVICYSHMLLYRDGKQKPIYYISHKMIKYNGQTYVNHNKINKR